MRSQAAADGDKSTSGRTRINQTAKTFQNRRHYRTPAMDARRIGLRYSEDETSFKTSLYRHVGAVVDRKWLVIAVALAVLLGSVVYAYTRSPVYISSAVLKIQANPQQAVGFSKFFDSFAYFSIFYQTHLELLKSGNLPAPTQGPLAFEPQGGPQVPTAARPAAVNPNAGYEGPSQAVSSALRQKPSFTKMNVGGEEQTRLIRLQISSNDPFTAREELRKYIEEYIEADRVQRVQLAEAISDGLRKELAQAESRLSKSQQELLDFSIRHDVIGLRKSPTQSLALFDAARENFMNSRAERWRLEGVKKELQKALPGTKTDAVLQDLKAKAAAMRSEYESLGPYLGPRNLQREMLKSKAESLEKAIAEIEADTLSASLQTARNKETRARDAFDKAKLDAMKTDSLAVKYHVLKKTVEADSQLYIRTMRHLREATLYDAIMEDSIAVENSPTLPLEPASPKKGKIIGMGALLGLLGAVGLALFLGYLDKTVKSVDEVRSLFSIPPLGVAPRISVAAREDSGTQPEMEPPELSPFRWPTSPLADSLRIVLNAVTTQLNTDSRTVIAVSSALPREGKTFLSVALAAVIASEGKAILVIDGDLRNPRVHRVFGASQIPVGVTDVLAGKCAGVLEAIHDSPIPGLRYMPSGPIPGNPVSTLKSRSMRDLIRTCRRAFDMVLIDTPPILGLADATVLTGYSDGLILVAKQGSTPLDAIRAAKEEVLRVNGRLLGVVLNMAERRIGHYDYYHSEQYARYHDISVSDNSPAGA